MTKESTEAAFRKAFSNYTLLNLSPEEEASIREYYGLDKPIPSEQEYENFEQQLTLYPNLYKTYQRQKGRKP